MKADYEKAEQAVKLLEESGVKFILVFANNNKKHKLAARGEYKSIKQCIISALTRVAELIYDNGYSEYIAAGELQKMAIIATQLWHEKREKKEKE